jgi:hypothetical protein
MDVDVAVGIVNFADLALLGGFEGGASGGLFRLRTGERRIFGLGFR